MKPKSKRQRFRNAPDEDMLYGSQAVREALRAGRRALRELYVRTDSATDVTNHWTEMARQAGVTLALRDANWFEQTLSQVRHQGVALRTGGYVYADFRTLLETPRSDSHPGFWLLLDHIQDPQNLGALMRTADAAGVTGLLLPKDRAVGVTPAAVRASAGASEHLSVCRVVNIVQTIETLKKAGVWIYGLDADPAAADYAEQDYGEATGLVLGAEGRGLSRLARECCDKLVRLPMYGRVESLNVGVAGAIAMYEVARQRTSKNNPKRD